MMYKSKVAVCSDIRTKHSTQSERHIEFLNINLLKSNGYMMHQQVKHSRIVHSAHTVCVLCLSQNKW